jgi:hypothetical protein
MLTGWMLCAYAEAATPAAAETAKQLVDKAREAAMAGDQARQFALLRQAVRIAPNDAVARSQLGQIQVDGQWMAVEEAQHRAASDPKQVHYRKLRQEHGESPEGQLALARWCRRNDLDEEARFHWASVLSVDPVNQEALRAVDMRWQNGQLITREDLARQKRQLRQANLAAKRWATKVAKWRRAVSGNDSAQREQALEEIGALTAIDVIPAVEDITLDADAFVSSRAEEGLTVSLAFIGALGNMTSQAATESIVRHAVFSPFAEARAAAIEELKETPPHNYVPLLLNGLAMPIESSFSVTTSSDGSVHYMHSLYREGQETDWAFDARLSAVQQDFSRFAVNVLTGRIEERDLMDDVAVARRKAQVATRYQSQYGSTAAATEWQVWSANLATIALNSRILPVLLGATSQDLGEDPKAWWKWWNEQNEYYTPDEHPVERQYYSDTDSFYYPPGPQPVFGAHSCFPKGTLVWTKTGQQPIETLELGDLVLSQNVETGQLAYKPVVRRTVRPPSQVLEFSFEDSALQVTGSHPLWVAGIGWRMAKELDEGAVLYTLTGTARVAAVEPIDDAEAYNLAVADFNTYFVGESGVLAHDVTRRRPTRATLPGVSAR